MKNYFNLFNNIMIETGRCDDTLFSTHIAYYTYIRVYKFYLENFLIIKIYRFHT